MSLRAIKPFIIMMGVCALLYLVFILSNRAHSQTSVLDISQQTLINLLDKTSLGASTLLEGPGIHRDYILIDVRSPTEFKAGHVRTAVNIPHNEILENISLLDPYLEKDMIFYCRSGGRAGKVTRYLTELEYKGLYHLDGDFMGWQDSNLDIAQ